MTALPPFPILGQDRALALLARARRHGRLAHAYLFTGPEGCGKATLARAFAAALLCRHADDDPAAEACGECPSCRQMLSVIFIGPIRIAHRQFVFCFFACLSIGKRLL